MVNYDMDLSLNRALGDRYKSETQKVRVISEEWAERNVFCCFCGGPLERGQNNARVLDFTCATCQKEFELKSTRRNFSGKIPDGAYKSMMDRLRSAYSPDFFFLTYSVESFCVTNFFAVPTYFFDSKVIEKRKPLSPKARRAGWIGCNIIMSSIPEVGKVYFIKNSKIQKRSNVLEAWGRTTKLRQDTNVETKGWALEVLRNIQYLKTREFTLQQMYEFESQLKQRFPNNNFIRAKIRQQLQVLRDAGFVNFKGRGRYVTNIDPVKDNS